MCYNALTDGDAEEKEMIQLLREEFSAAVKDGAIAATVVLLMLVAGGIGPALVAGATVVTFVLGIALHQIVLVAGVGVLRLRSSATVEVPKAA